LTLGGNNSSTTYNGVISGTGGLTKNGSGSMILNGINDFTGDTRIKAGQLVIGENDHSHASAQVGGSLYNDATLVGHGTIQGNVYNYGTLSPGYRTNMSGSGTLQERGLGTLQVTGDYQGENGILDIQLDFQPGPGVIADQLTIAGTANLSGTTLRVTKSANELDYGDQFQIIDADTYVGQVDLFDISQFTNQMFFDNSTGIVYATGLTQQQTLADMDGLNTNQVNIAESLAAALVQEHGNSDFMDENLPLDAAVISMITDFDNSQTKINSLSPEAYAAFADYGIQVTRSYTRTAMNISETPRESSALRSIKVPTSKNGSKGGIATGYAPDLGKTSMFGGFSHYDVSSTSSHNNADYDLTSTGGVMGFRHDVPDYSFGGFIGHDDGDVSSNYVNADVKGTLIGGFAEHTLNDAHNCTFDGGATYGHYRFDGIRQSVFGSATFNGGDTSVFHVFTSVKGDLYKTEKLRLSPSFGLHYLNAKTDSILENGIGTALNVDGMRNEALLAEWDFKVEYKVVPNFLLTGSVGYTHNFVDAGRDVSASFVAGGSPFNVTAPGLGNNILSTSIGASWQIDEALNIGTGYRAEFSSDSNVASSVGIGASYRF
jgi:autotransporter-associated beta strand protein